MIRLIQERDGFQIRQPEFHLPEETSNLDHQSKRAITICNLFVNYHYGISDVVRILDEKRRNVVLVLINQGIIRDRRGRHTKPPEGIERRTPLVRPKATLRTA